jgi:hypothetical protein
MQWTQAIFIARPKHEEASARWRQHPLVTIPRVEIADAIDIERIIAGVMLSITG